ncbi:MAG: hypothetical protein FWG19_00075 [Methanomassiliicoccaceae archaeon]|nr:hypothetical protein [Methanomassiliicoccaceae archaeon]
MRKGHHKISHKKFIDSVTAPGIVNLLAGKRGQGKTATFVSMLQPAAEGTIRDYGRKIEVITNIVFAEGGKHGRSMPPHVHYADTVEKMFRIMLEIYDKYGNHTRIAVGMDEAQQHMLADQNADPVNQAMLSFLAVTRKFNVSLWFMSPIRTNLVPKIRQFIDDPVKAGNLDFYWFKDLPRIRRFIKMRGLETDPFQYIVWQPGADHKGQILFVPETSWLKKVDDLKIGEYAYDDEAAATFRYGEHPDFDHQVLLDMCSGQRKHDLPEMLREYFRMLDAGEFADEKGNGHGADDQVTRVRRARENKVPWKTIEVLEGTNRNTLRSRMDKQTSSQKLAASINDDGEIRDGGTT